MAEDEKILKEAKKLAWEDRLAHKNWKVRVDANSDICALCDGITDPKDHRLKEFGPFFKKAIADSNAPAQEKALDALISYLRVVDAESARYAKETCDSVVVKCLTGRVKTVEKAQAVLLLWVELEATEVFLDAMEKAVKNKVSKVVVLAIDVMYQAVSQFGTKVVPPKKILKMLSELFDHQDQNVRAAAKGLTIELCRWIGKDTVKNILFEKMRDTMKRELELEVDSVVGVSRPTRKIRSEQLKACELEALQEVTAVGSVNEAASSDTQETDDYELMDPVDILGPLGKSTFWEGVKATKWSERRDAVAELTRLASARRLATGDYVEVSRILKKLITDVNLAVAVEAVQAAGNLARGLRKDYGGSSRMLLPLLLERFKEKKAVMVDAVMQTLKTMHGSGCFTLGDVVEDVKVATKNKVPSIRSQCLTWVGHCAESCSKASIIKQYKEYVPILMECLNDGTPEVRDAAFGAIAAIAKLVGLKPLEKSLEKLDDIKRKKLIDLIGVDGTMAAPTAGSVPSRAPVSISGGQSVGGIVTAAPGNRSAASLLSNIRLPPQIISSKISNGKPSSTKKADGVDLQVKLPCGLDRQEVTEHGETSAEDIESLFLSHFEAAIVTNLKSAVWKERLEGILTLQDKVESIPNPDSLVEILVRFLSVVPGWMEKNVQVQQKMMEMLSMIAGKSSRFSKRCAALCLTGVVERIADVKTRAQATMCLTAFCEAVEPGFVVQRLLEVWKDHKNPKVASEGLLWLVTALEDFGPGQFPVKEIIAFCKDVALQSSAAPTRNSAIKVIGVLHKSCGPDIKLYFSDVKPALQTLVNAECEKNPFEGQVLVPKRTTRASISVEAVPGGAMEPLPREDISGKLTASLLKNFTSADWKVRQESIEAVSCILQEANMRIEAAGTVDLVGALKGRLGDSNKNLIILTLATLGKLALAMGPAFEKSLKVIHLDVLKCLGDNKKLMREATIKTLDSWLAVIPLGKLIPYLIPAIVDMKLCADGRKDIFEWLLRHVGQLDIQSDVTLLLKPIGTGAQDKNAEVRKAAELLFLELMKSGSKDMVMKAIKSLQGNIQSVLVSLIDRHRIMNPSGGKKTSNEEDLKRPVSKHTVGSKQPARGLAVSSRGSNLRSSVTKSLNKEAIAAVFDAVVEGSPLNLKDCNKEEREKSTLRRSKWEEPRGDQLHEVDGDLLKYFREDVHRKLSSTDFRKQVEGVDILQKSIPSYLKEIIEVLDLLLRWIVHRICESNTVCLLKVLEFLQELFIALRDEEYALTDWEAFNIIPCLVEKSGHNIEKVREKMRDLMRMLCLLYPSSKVFTYIADGLKSKNNRTRIECVEHIGFMIERYGVEVGGSVKGLHLVATLTTERDGDLRKACLQTLATAYQILGEDVWKHLGKLSAPQRGYIDEKFKWKGREMDKKGLRCLPESRGINSPDFSGEAGRRSGGMLSNGSPTIQPKMPESTMMQSFGPVDWDEAIVAIETGTVSEQVVEGMKIICYELELAVGDMEGDILDRIAASADRLVCSLTGRVCSTFKAGLCGSSTRACKYVLNTLMQTFQVKKLACEIKQNTLHALITELLLWLLDDRVPLLDDGSQLLKALNVLMLKILENANRTSAFVVLIDLLQPSCGIVQSSIPRFLEESVLSSQRFSDLVVKCLIKLTKVLGSTIADVDLDRLLQSIHEFFHQLGLEEIRKRAGADDKPLRMVKTVLHELVKLRGTAIKGHLSMVPIDSEPQPIILAYIDLNLQTLAASRILAPTVTGSQLHWLDTGGNGSKALSSTSAETQLKQELASIFKKIGDKQTSTIGLYELYRITQLYPQVDIFSQLQTASLTFRTYIRDGLTQMEKSASSGRIPVTSSFMPLPTPSSPGQLLTKGTNVHSPISDVENIPSSISNTFMEDAEVGGGGLSLSEFDLYAHKSRVPQRFMETVSATSPEFQKGTVPQGLVETVSRTPSDVHKSTVPQRFMETVSMTPSEVHKSTVPQKFVETVCTTSEGQGGTLNAIRERMKIIQAAAAGSTGAYSLSSVGSLDTVPRNSFSGGLDHSDVETVPDKALSELQARMERLKKGLVG